MWFGFVHAPEPPLSAQDKAETIRSMCIGVSAHQKLDLLSSLVRLCGYESVAVFGDCFDEVVLLDPVQYPGGEPCRPRHLSGALLASVDLRQVLSWFVATMCWPVSVR